MSNLKDKSIEPLLKHSRETNTKVLKRNK